MGVALCCKAREETKELRPVSQILKKKVFNLKICGNKSVLFMPETQWRAWTIEMKYEKVFHSSAFIKIKVT